MLLPLIIVGILIIIGCISIIGFSMVNASKRGVKFSFLDHLYPLLYMVVGVVIIMLALLVGGAKFTNIEEENKVK